MNNRASLFLRLFLTPWRLLEIPVAFIFLGSTLLADNPIWLNVSGILAVLMVAVVADLPERAPETLQLTSRTRRYYAGFAVTVMVILGLAAVLAFGAIGLTGRYGIIPPLLALAVGWAVAVIVPSPIGASGYSAGTRRRPRARDDSRVAERGPWIVERETFLNQQVRLWLSIAALVLVLSVIVWLWNRRYGDDNLSFQSGLIGAVIVVLSTASLPKGLSNYIALGGSRRRWTVATVGVHLIVSGLVLVLWGTITGEWNEAAFLTLLVWTLIGPDPC